MSRLDPQALSRALGAAAVVLAVTSRGDVAVLGLLLVLAEPSPACLLTVGSALVASSWRSGATSLEALAGAQSVLGPAAVVGPAAAAVGSCLAGAAVVLVLARRDPVRIAAVGATVAALVAGAGSGAGLAVRAAVAVGVGALAWAVDHVLAARPRLERPSEVLAVLAGVGALVAVGRAAPAWPPHLDPATVGTGLAVAVAVAALALVGPAAARRPRWSRGWARPRLSGPDRRHPTVPSGPR